MSDEIDFNEVKKYLTKHTDWQSARMIAEGMGELSARHLREVLEFHRRNGTLEATEILVPLNRFPTKVRHYRLAQPSPYELDLFRGWVNPATGIQPPRLG